MLRSGAAIAVTKSMSPITQRYSDGWGWKWDGSTEDDMKTDFVRMAADADFSRTLGVKIIQGRDIDVYKYPTDSNALLLNEAAVKIMRLKNPVGAIIDGDGEKWQNLHCHRRRFRQGRVGLPAHGEPAIIAEYGDSFRNHAFRSRRSD